MVPSRVLIVEDNGLIALDVESALACLPKPFRDANDA
jgi:hypothetical protein